MMRDTNEVFPTLPLEANDLMSTGLQVLTENGTQRIVHIIGYSIHLSGDGV